MDMLLVEYDEFRKLLMCEEGEIVFICLLVKNGAKRFGILITYSDQFWF